MVWFLIRQDDPTVPVVVSNNRLTMEYETTFGADETTLTDGIWKKN